MDLTLTHVPGEPLMVLIVRHPDWTADGPANADVFEYVIQPDADPGMVAALLRLLADKLTH
jgi:hypothetical protein